MIAQPLRARLDEARRAAKLSMGDLSVLSTRKDPYRLDTPSLHRDGAWLAEQIDRLAVRLPIHLRGLHYAIVATGGVLKPDGKPYTNTEADWIWLQEVAAKAARWLGYVPFESIIDNRNDGPTIFVPEQIKPRPAVYCSFDFQLPDPSDLLPTASLRDFAPRQPYRICLCGEKASLHPVLQPLARRYLAELVLPTGEMSDTLISGIASRAAADGRPLVVLYFSDFDPSGWQMPISVTRKLQALGDLMPKLPAVQVHRVAMMVDQVKSLDLPSTPLKETERRADGWRARRGREQTEIDALAQLRPRDLERIAENAIKPFWDTTLERRASEARWKWKQQADQLLTETVDDEWLESARLQLTALVDGVRPELERLQQELELDTDGVDLPPIPDVEPNLEGLPSRPQPLFCSSDDWTTATRRLVADRALAGEVEP